MISDYYENVVKKFVIIVFLLKELIILLRDKI